MIFNIIEATGFSTSPYDQWFNNFLSSNVNKESTSQTTFSPSFLTLFIQLDLSQVVPRKNNLFHPYSRYRQAHNP